MKIGWMPPSGEDLEPGLPVRYADIAMLAQEAESAGLEALWLSDHLLFRSPGEPSSAPWEAWTMLAALAAATSRVELGTLVTATSFRAPGMLAKQAHTVQEISGGRLILGIGAGWHEPEYTAYGFPFDHRGGRFAEAVEIIATLIREGRADFAGQYYSVKDCLLLPHLAAGIGPPPILIAGRGPRMMQLTARWADAWNGAWYGFPSARFREEGTRCTRPARQPDETQRALRSLPASLSSSRMAQRRAMHLSGGCPRTQGRSARPSLPGRPKGSARRSSGSNHPSDPSSSGSSRE